MYRTKERNNDTYCLCETAVEFKEWLNDCGWVDAAAFASCVAVEFEELKGKWFTVVHNRVFTLDGPTSTLDAKDFVMHLEELLSSDGAKDLAATKVEFFDDPTKGVIVTNRLGRWAISVERQDW